MRLDKLLERLQACDECNRIEAKEAHVSLGKSVRETISAFSNEPDLGGGYLILGLQQNHDRFSGTRYFLTGVQDPDKVQCELASACREEFNTKLSPDIRVELINNKVLVVAFIPESAAREKPVYIKKLGVEKGAFRRIGSADHRCTIHDLDLLYQLRSLRDLGFLIMCGGGSSTYYRLAPNNEGLTPHIRPLSEGLAPHIRSLDEEVKKELSSFGKRSGKNEVKDIIKKLYSLRPFPLAQLAKILDRDPRYLRDNYLSPMIKQDDLLYQYPDQPAHPQQAYITAASKKS